MNETLGQIVDRIAEEEFDSPEKTNFRRAARRLVAALGAQEPVAWVRTFKESPPIFVSVINGNTTFTCSATDALLYQPLYTAPVVKEGWQMVPKEPTPEMVISGNAAMSSPNMARHTVRGCYKAMLSAAPEYKP